MLPCRTYKAATAELVADDLNLPNDFTDAAAAVDDAYYQLPLAVEEIYWVDSVNSFHSSISHIAQVHRDVDILIMQLSFVWVGFWYF